MNEHVMVVVNMLAWHVFLWISHGKLQKSSRTRENQQGRAIGVHRVGVPQLSNDISVKKCCDSIGHRNIILIY